MENWFYIKDVLIQIFVLLITQPPPPILLLQSDEECCNNCEDVREAYRKKGWALSNPDVIDQVCLHESLPINIYFEYKNIAWKSSLILEE